MSTQSSRPIHSVAPIERRYHTELQIGYLASGMQGLPLVMLHGWGAFKELWWSTLRDLGRDYCCYALDLPGHGESPRGTISSMAQMADHVAHFCEISALEGITLFGHSMGGCVAVELALRRPDLVKRLILVDPAVDAAQMPAFSRTYLTPRLGWPTLRLMQITGRSFRPLGQRVPHEHGGGWIRPWLRRSAYLTSFDPYSLHVLLQSLFRTEAGDRLAHLTMPTLVISGQLDTLVPPAHSRRIAERIPRAVYVEIPGALHNPMDERPHAFVRAVRAFL